MASGDGGLVLDVRDLHVWFPIRRGLIDTLLGRPKLYVRAVDGVSFNIRERETFCLVGESGCGKTTTGKALLRLVPITRGQALFKPSREVAEILEARGVELGEDGMVDIFSLKEGDFHPVRRDIQMVYQDPYGSLDPRFRVRDILEEPLLVHKIGETRSERLELVSRALEMVKLTPVSEFIDRYPHQLSGGQRQRVAIARAIIMNPRLVVADEPVSMLDVSIRAEILEVFNLLKERLGLSFIFITHDLSTARYVCDRIAVMYLGKIVELGPSDEVIQNPQHPYTEALIAAVPEPDPKNRHGYREIKIKGEVPSAVAIPGGCRFHPRCIVLDQARERGEGWAKLCTEMEPPLVEVRKGHYAACFRHEAARPKFGGSGEGAQRPSQP
ncbi:MAG: ABC transporter ATP-binding protein [Desulfurococcales archaeon]|nr:ABC transporter ATP-binding protein [Desulfurococcales archaeon]